MPGLLLPDASAAVHPDSLRPAQPTEGPLYPLGIQKSQMRREAFTLQTTLDLPCQGSGGGPNHRQKMLSGPCLAELAFNFFGFAFFMSPDRKSHANCGRNTPCMLRTTLG
jgi:hypothetical protein